MSITLGAAAAIGGAALGSSALSALSSNAAVKKQIAWERERATHAHQWEVQDLKAAGLNPILSAGGSGATTGGVSAPVPDYSAIPNAANTIVTAGLEQQRVKNETDATAAGVEKTKTEQMNIMQDTINKMREEGLIDAKKAKEYSENVLNTGKAELMYMEIQRQKETLELEIAALKEEYKTTKIQAEKNRIQSEIDKKTAWVDKTTQILGNIVGMGTSIGKTKAALTSAKAAQDRTTGVLMSL